MTDLCSVASQSREEPMTATASRVARWLLVEHYGAWGPESVPSGRMPVAVARSLARTAADHQARLLLLRRPAGQPRPTGRWVYSVDSQPGSERILARHVEADADLTDLRPPYAGTAEGWDEITGPLYLVCTHGRHDRCCALRGRPVAAALAARFPERTWECTHVGGDRFAANLVVLPEGLYLGRLEASEVVAVVEGLTAGTLPAGHVRGRSSLPLPVQAAQHFAREASGRWGSNDLAMLSSTPGEADSWDVRLRGVDGPDVQVVVAHDRSAGGTHLLTCDADQAKPVPAFRRVSLRIL